MQKFITAALAAAFATGSSLAILAGGAQLPAQAYASYFSAAPALARADQDDENDQGNQNGNGHGNANGCVNPAGHERGRCKHNGENNDEGHHRRGGQTITGTVQSINGSTVYFLQNNGQPISFIDNTNRRFYVGQRVTVRVYNNNGQYALAPVNNNNGYNNGYNNGEYGQNTAQRSGVILAVSGSTLTFINGTSIDISQAQQRGSINGNLNIGRSVTAYGFVDGANVFHATSIQ